jgi:hypothetical protein
VWAILSDSKATELLEEETDAEREAPCCKSRFLGCERGEVLLELASNGCISTPVTNTCTTHNHYLTRLDQSNCAFFWENWRLKRVNSMFSNRNEYQKHKNNNVSWEWSAAGA